MKIEDLTITCENTKEFIALADGMDRLHRDMVSWARESELCKLSHSLCVQFEEYINERKIK